MITVTIEAQTPHEFKEKLSAFSGMIDRCCQTQGPDAACNAPCVQAPAEPETSTHDGVEYEEVVEEAPKKRGRKKKEETAAPVAEEQATEPAPKPEADPIADTLDMKDVQAELVKVREKVGVDAVRKLIADIGGQGAMLKDLPPSCYSDLLEKAKQLVAEAL